MPKSKDHHLNQENTLLRVSESLNRSLTQTDLIGATYQKSLTYSTLPSCGFLSLFEFAEVEVQALNAMDNTKRTTTAWSLRVLALHLELKFELNTNCPRNLASLTICASTLAYTYQMRPTSRTFFFSIVSIRS